jgi:uncharacterized protein YcfJ
MRNKLWVVGLTAVALVVPQLASADTCEDRAHHRRVVGTVAGAAGGALIGGLVGHGAAAPLIGAGAGAIVGNQVARTKCYHHYHSASYHHHHDYRHYG